MSSLALVTNNTAPRRQASPSTVREIVEQLQRRHARASESRLVELLEQKLEVDDDARAIVAKYVVHNMHIAAAGRKVRSENLPPTSEIRRRKQERTEQAAKAAETVILLNLIMPNNKQMRFCSGAEMAGFGEAYGRIAEACGERLVGAVLCEHEVKALVTL